MTRLEKLYECLEIAKKHNNTYMQMNIENEIAEEAKSPSYDSYPDPTDDKETA